MLTVVLERGARWTEEVSRAACAHQTAPTSHGKDQSAVRMERPTKTNAHCWRLNVKATQTWTCNTRESARVSQILVLTLSIYETLGFSGPRTQLLVPFSCVSFHFYEISLSRQKRAVTSCAPEAPHALWTRPITPIVWRVIGFAPRWRHLSSTCVETMGSSTPARVTWEEQPVSSVDPSEWHMRGNA